MTTNNAKQILEKKYSGKVSFREESDGVSLLFTAWVNGRKVARIYKTYDFDGKNYNQAQKISWCR
jgi:hypothetical protein